ncbi:hypothetical protein F6X54_32060 [Micromonospora aurantiaca]|uniref:GNAT family N-acetyltransferase n=1 Tax=Micromonospora aurantiaca (nom. illeg.) TaxID=47850 RepID=A0A3M9JX46_9ACTN|nr:hypothetical protein DVH21_17220 [Micromonospora aurantiaca]KAB1100366.1 hypothetical protein F6X54_32060 [Micromonospora aurantiaca]RNH92537.1 hypothetical protein EEZ25_33775 [Micromonospora aurantiaca]
MATATRSAHPPVPVCRRPRPPGERGAVRPATSSDLDTVAGLARGSAGLVRHQGTEQHLDT